MARRRCSTYRQLQCAVGELAGTQAILVMNVRSNLSLSALQVMESRGWKPSCPPRVPDEDLTTPYVDHWEETDGMIDSRGAHPSPPEEPHRYTLPSVAVANHGDGNGGAIVPVSSDSSAMVAPSHQENSSGPSPGRASQAWDLHWSYTKWAVETMRFARKLAPWQRVNHFRNSNELCRKVLWGRVP